MKKIYHKSDSVSHAYIKILKNNKNEKFLGTIPKNLVNSILSADNTNITQINL